MRELFNDSAEKQASIVKDSSKLEVKIRVLMDRNHGMTVAEVKEQRVGREGRLGIRKRSKGRLGCH